MFFQTQIQKPRQAKDDEIGEKLAENISAIFKVSQKVKEGKSFLEIAEEFKKNLDLKNTKQDALSLAKGLGLDDIETANKYFQDAINSNLTDHQISMVKNLQTLLTACDLYCGEIDGKFGSLSQTALNDLRSELELINPKSIRER